MADSHYPMQAGEDRLKKRAIALRPRAVVVAAGNTVLARFNLAWLPEKSAGGGR